MILPPSKPFSTPLYAMSDSAEKLTKKQRKTQEFRAKSNGGATKDDAGSTGAEVKAAVPTPRPDAEVVASSVVTPDRKGKRKATDEGDAEEPRTKPRSSPRSQRKAKRLLLAQADGSAPEVTVGSFKTRQKNKKRKLGTKEERKKAKKERQAEKLTAKRKGPSKKKGDAAAPATATAEEKQEEAPVKGGDEEVAAAAAVVPTTAAVDEEDGKSKRYILFVGNMSFKTTSDGLAKHFAEHCAERPQVRLLTSKGDATTATAQTLSKSKQKSIAKGKALDPSAAEKSRGCAFVEFVSRDALQKALQFHHTQLHGRVINVELTAGGGGAGAERKEKIKKKNEGLDEERKKLHEKYVKTGLAAKKTAKKDGEAEAPVVVEEKRPMWGPNAATNGKARTPTKVPRWAASGANAVKLNI